MTESLNTFFSAWGDPSAESRAEKCSAAFASDFSYTDPMTDAPVTSLSKLVAYVGNFGAAMPDGSAQVANLSMTLSSARATVDFCKDGTPMQRGQYFVEFDGERIARMVGFAGMGEPA